MRLFFCLLLLGGLFFLNSCSSDDISGGSTNGSLSVTIDGQPIAFNPVSIIAIGSPTPPYALAIQGIVQGTSMDLFAIVVNLGNTPQATFFESIDDCRLDEVCHVMEFTIDESQSDEQYFSSGDIDGSRSSIQFEQLNYEEGGIIKGSFSGTLIREETGKAITVSDGQFEIAMTLED